MIARAWAVVIGDVPRICPMTRLSSHRPRMMNSARTTPYHTVEMSMYVPFCQVPSELVHEEDPDGPGEDDRRDREPEQPLDRTRCAAFRQAHRRRPQREQRDHRHQQTHQREHLRGCADTARMPHAPEIVGSKVQIGEEEGELQRGVGGHHQPRAEEERAFTACDVLDGRQSGRACGSVSHLMHRSARASPIPRSVAGLPGVVVIGQRP